MKQFIKTPPCWILIYLIVLIISTTGSWNTTAIDIQMHNTYYVMSYGSVVTVISVFLVLVAIVYAVFRLIKRPLNLLLAIIHLVLTLFSLTMVLFIGFYFEKLLMSRAISPTIFQHFERFYEFNTIVFSFFLGQGFFLVNIIRYGLIKPKVHK